MFRVEYQYSGRDWWVDLDDIFKTKGARTRYINKKNEEYEFINFRAKSMIEKAKKVVIYTDGSAYYKDRLGGIGVYIKFGKHEKIISRGYSNTTNNRMELRAVVEAMKALTLKSYPVEIYTDSELVVNTFTSWIFTWEENNYRDRANVDLLKEGIIEWRKFPEGNITIHWCKGHNGIEGNEIADILAGEGRKGETHILCQPLEEK